MTIAVITAVTIIVGYSIGFTVTLWKDKNKTGAIAVFFLTVAVGVSSYFGFFK